MKRKIEKKISLNKTTVANLDNVDLEQVKGGTAWTVWLSCTSMCVQECNQKTHQH